MFQRIVSRIGASKPAETRVSHKATMRSEVEPSGSPKRLNRRYSIRKTENSLGMNFRGLKQPANE
jgi:hypothetical protein